MGNWASRRLAWKLGFSFGGVAAGVPVHRGGQLVDAWSGDAAVDRRAATAEHLAGGAARSPTASSGCAPSGPSTSTGWWRRPATSAPALAGPDALPYTGIEERRAWLEQVTEEAATGRTVTWAVTGAEDDVLRGVVNLFDLEPGELGRGRLLGASRTPAARADDPGVRCSRCTTGSPTFDLVRVQGHAALGNAASRHVLEAAGCARPGVARLGTFIRPEGRVDAMKYDVLVEEWRATRHSAPRVISG